MTEEAYDALELRAEYTASINRECSERSSKGINLNIH